jgi:hypothetical protein
MDEAGIRRKIASFSHQEFNNEKFLSSIDVSSLVLGGEDLFRRPGFLWSIVDPAELPEWLKTHRRSLERLFLPKGPPERFNHWVFAKISCANRKGRKTSPPVIICPYVYPSEAIEIRAKFALDQPHGRQLEFFLWQDVDRIGPEHAFEACWERFPERDIIIVHSDMAPIPDDKSNEWYDALLHYRSTLPKAGMIACNLFFPRSCSGEPLRVQCAGGTFRNGQINHLHGPVIDDPHKAGEGVPRQALQQTRVVEWVTFAGVLIRREVIRACGSFDRRYRWAYVMDVDYCFEARLRGYHLFQVPVSLQHEESRTTKPVLERDPTLWNEISRNFELFSEKWQPFNSILTFIRK